MARSMPQAAPTNPAGPRNASTDLPGDLSRDQWGRPLINPVDGGDPRAFTRASSLGGALEDQFGVSRWKMALAAYGTAIKPDLRLALAAVADPHSPQGKRDLYPLADAALEAADASAAARLGTAIHALSELVDRGDPLPPLEPEERDTLAAYARLAEHFTMHAAELFVVNDDLEAAGTFDRLLSPRPGTMLVAPDGTVLGPEDRLIGDVKTSSTANFFGIKFAVQLAVYAGGRPYRVTAAAQGKAKARGERVDWPDGIAPNRHWGVILHVPSGGSIAEPYWVDLQLGAKAAHLAVTVREWRSRKDLVLPAGLPGPDPAAHDARDEAAERRAAGMDAQDEIDRDNAEAVAWVREAARTDQIIRDAIAGAGSDAACRALYARFRETWTPDHTAAVKARLAELGVSA